MAAGSQLHEHLRKRHHYLLHECNTEPSSVLSRQGLAAVAGSGKDLRVQVSGGGQSSKEVRMRAIRQMLFGVLVGVLVLDAASTLAQGVLRYEGSWATA
jgi:hypothetical protein